jgi:hypothetical protein
LQDSLQLFIERQGHFVSSGLSGRALYEALAADTALPLYFTSNEAAAIAGLGTEAMAKRRARKMPPSYISHSHRSVLYPRADLCAWLSSLFVDRSAA